MTRNYKQHRADSYRTPDRKEVRESWRSDRDWRDRSRQRSRSPVRANNDSTRESGEAPGPVSDHRRNDSGVELPRSSGQTPAIPATVTPPSLPSRREAEQAATDDDIEIGKILQLPRNFTVGVNSPSILLRGQPWVNDKAANHPVLIWDVMFDETGEKIARCLQMTSFGERSVEGKYNEGRNAWKMHLQYVPIQQGSRPTWSATNMPSLELEGQMSMEKQTYVHIDHYYDIEARHLRKNGPQLPMRLTYESLCVVTYKMSQFVRGFIWRNTKCSVKSPLDRCDVPKLEFTSPAQERSDKGADIEDERLKHFNLRHWHGYETNGPWY